MSVSYPKSAAVVADTTATAAQYNNLRADAVESRIVSLTAGENLTALDAVYVKAADGKAYKAKGVIGATSFFFGFVTATVTTGNAASIVCFGYLDGFSGLNTGFMYYTSATTFGAISAINTPSFTSLVGIAVSSTTMLVMPNNWPNMTPATFYATGGISTGGYLSVAGDASVAGTVSVGGTAASNIGLDISKVITGTTQYGIKNYPSVSGATVYGYASYPNVIDNVSNLIQYESGVVVASGKTVTRRVAFQLQNNGGSGAVTNTYFLSVGSQFLSEVTTHTTPAAELKVDMGGWTGYITINS